MFNAANEIAVEAFLEERIGFPEMGEVVSKTLDRLGGRPVESSGGGSGDGSGGSDRQQRS